MVEAANVMSSTVGRSRVGPLNLRQIEVFHAIMTTGSLSEAGRLLCVSQPAISRVLATAEHRLKFALFERVKGRLKATPEAQRLFNQVAAIHEQVGQLNVLATGMADGNVGHLKIVSGPSFGEWVMPNAIKRFHARHPDVRVKYRPLALDSLMPHLAQGLADIAISCWNSPMDANLTSRQIGEGQVLCAIPNGHPLARTEIIRAADLVGQTYIGYGSDTPFGRLVESFSSTLSVELTPDIEVRSAPDALAMVRQGIGLALIDSFSVTPTLHDGLTFRPISPAMPLKLYLLHSRLNPLSMLAKGFVSTLRHVLESEFPEDAGTPQFGRDVPIALTPAQATSRAST